MWSLSVFNLMSFFAQAGGEQKPESCATLGLSQIIMIGALFAIFYFFLIRPQQKKAKAHQEMLKALKKGDKVVTSGGLIGTVSGVADKFLTVEIAEKIRVRVLRSHISGREGETETGSRKGEDKK
jgi:preprotein translocase subunit YajC